MCRFSFRISALVVLLLCSLPQALGWQQSAVYSRAEWQAKVEEYMEQQPDTAFILLDEAWQAAVRDKDLKLQAWVLKRSGTLYMYLSDFSRSIEHYLRALEIYKETRDSNGIAGMYMNLGNVADSKEEKIDFYQKSIEMYSILENEQGVAKNPVNVGTTYLDHQEMDSARVYFEKALALSQQIGSTVTITSSLLNLAIVYENAGEVQKAISTIEKALVYYEKEGVVIGKVYSYFNLSQFHLRLGNLETSEKFLEKTLETAQNSFLNIQQLCFQTFKEISVQRGDYELAVEYQKVQDSLSVLNNESSTEKLFSRMESEYNARIKEATVEKLHASISQSLYIKIMLLGLLGMALLFSGVSFYLQRDSWRKKQALLVQEREYAQTQHQLAMVELEYAELKEKKLNARLQYTEAELLNFAVNLVQNNEIIEELRGKINGLKRTAGSQKEHQALRDFNETLLSLTDRNKAKAAFFSKAEELNNDLLSSIGNKYQSLTEDDRELLMLIILKLNYKEIASISGVKPSTVIVKRYKLRKKLGIRRGETFEYFIRKNIYSA